MTGSYAGLTHRFGPAFEDVARGEAAREAGRHLPFAALEQLRSAGIGALTLPVDAGGDGAGQEDVLRLLMDLAAVDANTAHLLRSHLSFVEHVLAQPDETLRAKWLERVADGDLAGSALSEAQGPALGEVNTTVSWDEAGQLRISGRKYYTTGSIFATWTLATARLDDGVPAPGRRRGGSRRGSAAQDDARLALAIVRVRQPRATVKDDWDGFGQRLTGTGSVEFSGAGVEDLLALPPTDGHVPLHHEATLMALLAGVGRAALRDGIDQTRRRRRSPNTAGGLTPREDDQLLGIIGELSAQQAAAEELVRAAGRDLDEALASASGPSDGPTGRQAPDGVGRGGAPGVRAGVGRGADADGDDGAVTGALRRAALTAHRAHVMVPRLVLDTCTRIFDTLGASATSTDLQLDRHWRNARTLASHDPAVFMARMVGDWEVNGTAPVPYLSTGTA